MQTEELKKLAKMTWNNNNYMATDICAQHNKITIPNNSY